MSVQDVYL
ncbi:hypothetical protein CISIN_1g0421172mg, partial [Citrus sinensis]